MLHFHRQLLFLAKGKEQVNPHLQEILNNITTRLVALEDRQGKKEWVGLTEAERLEIIAVGGEAAVLYVTEAKLREKNSG